MKQDYKKKKKKKKKKKTKKKNGPGTSDKLLFQLQNSFRKKPLLVVYYLIKFGDVL